MLGMGVRESVCVRLTYHRIIENRRRRTWIEAAAIERAEQ